jgi:hypothetical protein
MALPKYVLDAPQSNAKAEGFKFQGVANHDYKEFSNQERKDFYDLMTPHWSNAMAKQYKIDAEEEEYYKGFNGLNNKDISNAINPSHYKGIVGNYQYIECMEFILGKEGLKAHLIGQVYKYMMRLGKKDADLQEVGKVVWYSRCLEILLRDGTIIGKLNELK